MALLGRFEVIVGERVLGPGDWPVRKAAALVKLLALAPEQRLHRDQLLDRLWPDLAGPAAANSLRVAVGPR